MKKILSLTLLGAVASIFAAGPAPDRPRMIIRFSSGEESPEVWPRMLKQLEKYRAGCDEVWFSNGTSVVSLETHRQRAGLMAKAAKDLRKIGIVPSLQIQSTIGHADNLHADNSALKWGTYVGRNGEKCKTINCPRQKAFHQYLYEMSKIYAEWHPGSVWIDDDLRLRNHAPAGEPYGCYCAECLAEFSKREKHDYTREELVSACEKDAALYRRWMDFEEEGLAMISSAIARGFKEISPETRMGLQHCYDLERNAVFKALYETSGKRVASRPGAGTYSDHDPYMILLKGIKMSQEIFSQPGYEMLDQVAPEIEDYPRVFSSKSDRGHQLEALFYLAMGGDSLTYYSITPNLETPEFYGEHILKPLAGEAACYRDFADHNLHTVPVGTGIVKALPAVTELGLPLVGIPFASHSTGACAIQLNKRVVDALSDAELKKVLKRDLILDGEAAALIAKRGFGDAIGGIRSVSGAEGMEVYPDHPFNAGIAGKFYRLTSPFRYFFECPESDNVQVLSRYTVGNKAATVLLTRPDGTRVALIGFDGFQTIFVSTSRVEFLTRIADWVSHGKIPVFAAVPVQCCFVPRMTQEGVLRSVTVINTVIGHQKPFVLKMRGVPANAVKAEWRIPGKAAELLPLTREGDFTCVTIPELEGWQGGWVKIENL
ncbi:MAG: hypothetical protein MJ033_02200 [Victivallaceae bacterium]|nr:hypothetical protein [Victivallaceae bacterium]